MTNASVGTFGVDFELQTARFREGVLVTKREMDGIAASAKRTFDRVNTYIDDSAKAFVRYAAASAALVAAAAPIALAALTARSIEAVGAQIDLAARLNTTTEKLAALQLAAGASGVENEALAQSLTRMTANIGKAEQGAKAQTEALAKLGLTAGQLANLRTDEQFALIAERMQAVESAGQRAAIAQEVFGKSGAALLPVMAEGAAGLAQIEKNALAMGFALTQVDAMKVDEAGDAMGRVGAAVTGLGNNIAVELAPYIAKASNDLVAMAIAAEGGRSQIALLVEKAVTGFAWVLQATQAVRVAWLGFTGVVQGLVAGFAEMFAFFERGFSATLRLIAKGILVVDDFTGMLTEAERRSTEKAAAYQANLFGRVRNFYQQTAMESFAAMREAASGELPVEAVKRWAAEARREAQGVAEALAAAQRGAAAQPNGEGGGAGGAQGSPAASQQAAAQAASQARIQTEAELSAALWEQTRQQILSRELLEQEAFARKLEGLRAGLELELITREEFNVYLQEQVALHEATITQIQQEEAAKRLTFQTMTSQQQVKTVLGDMVTLTAGVAQHNKTLFKINKAAALASALIAMPEHISNTMSKYPFPLSIAMGALAAAASLAQIQAIRSTSFSGGGGGTTPSSAGTVPSIGGNPVTNSQVADFSTTLRRREEKIDVVLEGNTFSSEGVRSLVEQITEALADNVTGKIVLRGA